MLDETQKLPPSYTRRYLKRLAVKGIHERFGKTPTERKWRFVLDEFSRRNLENMRTLVTGTGPASVIVEFFRMCQDRGVEFNDALVALNEMRWRLFERNADAIKEAFGRVEKCPECPCPVDLADGPDQTVYVQCEIVGQSVMINRVWRAEARAPP